jgi:hypothetical protein
MIGCRADHRGDLWNGQLERRAGLQWKRLSGQMMLGPERQSFGDPCLDS